MEAHRGANEPSGGGGISIGKIFLRRATPVLNPKLFRSYLGKRHCKAGCTAQRLKRVAQCHPQRTASDSTELERLCVYMCMHMCEGRMRRWQRHREGLGKHHFKNQAEGIYSLS